MTMNYSKMQVHTCLIGCLLLLDVTPGFTDRQSWARPAWFWLAGNQGMAGARPDLVWSPPVSPGLGGGPGGWMKGGPRTRPDQFGFRLFRPGVGGNWGGEEGP